MFGYGRQIINVSLRGVTLVVKFVFVFILALYLNPSEVGIYGLIVASIAYGMYPLGFDFYSYNIREVLTVNRELRGSLLKNQMALHLKLYVIVLPLFTLIFFFDLLPWKYAVYFFLLVVIEHINQELSRLLIALSKQLEASICLFVRQAAWVLIAVLYMHLDSDARSIEVILRFWMAGSFAALLLAGHTILKMRLTGWGADVDWSWIRRGLKVSIPFLIASLCLNSISTVDRYWFSNLMGKEVLAAYVFYVAICSSLLSFLDAAVFSFSYPRLVSSVAGSDHAQFISDLRKMTYQSLGVIVLFCVCAVAGINYVVELFGNDVYKENLVIFYIALFSISVHSFSYIYHYALYAYKRDSVIVMGHVLALIVFIISGGLVSMWNSLYAIPLSVLNAYLFIFIWKLLACKNLNREFSLLNLSEGRS